MSTVLPSIMCQGIVSSILAVPVFLCPQNWWQNLWGWERQTREGDENHEICPLENENYCVCVDSQSNDLAKDYT